MAWKHTRLSRVGYHGLITLVLSTQLIVVSFGFSFLWLFVRVYRIARKASYSCLPGQWILVLGMRLRDGKIEPCYAQRLERARLLHKENPESVIIILGGGNGKDDRTEASKGMEYLLARGVSRKNVKTEDRSYSTYENILQAREMLRVMGGGDTVLITSRYHLARSITIASRLALQHTPCAAEDHFTMGPVVFIRLLQEAYFLHWFIVSGVWVRLTNNERTLTDRSTR